jgi:hypothetical protein
VAHETAVHHHRPVTGGNEEALTAVQSCVDYLIGTEVG